MSGDLAAAGAATGNPYLAIGGMFAEGLGSALGSSGGPSSAMGSAKSGFDSSGWNVIFGDNAKLSTSRSQSEAGNFDQYIPYVLAGVGVLIVWRLTRKR